MFDPDDLTIDERTEVAMRNLFDRMRESLGDDGYDAFLIELAQQYEAVLRADCPDHPLLERLDEHRERQRLGLD